jgi:hypothetical protein
MGDALYQLRMGCKALLEGRDAGGMQQYHFDMLRKYFSEAKHGFFLFSEGGDIVGVQLNRRTVPKSALAVEINGKYTNTPLSEVSRRFFLEAMQRAWVRSGCDGNVYDVLNSAANKTGLLLSMKATNDDNTASLAYNVEEYLSRMSLVPMMLVDGGWVNLVPLAVKYITDLRANGKPLYRPLLPTNPYVKKYLVVRKDPLQFEVSDELKYFLDKGFAARGVGPGLIAAVALYAARELMPQGTDAEKKEFDGVKFAILYYVHISYYDFKKSVKGECGLRRQRVAGRHVQATEELVSVAKLAPNNSWAVRAATMEDLEQVSLNKSTFRWV